MRIYEVDPEELRALAVDVFEPGLDPQDGLVAPVLITAGAPLAVGLLKSVDLLLLESAPAGDGGGGIAFGGGDFGQVLAYVTQAAPSFSLRGGTREIIRGIIARGLGLR